MVAAAVFLLVLLTIQSYVDAKATPMVDFFNLKGYEKFEPVPMNVQLQVQYDLNKGKNAFAGNRPGQATETHSCDMIRSIPTNLNFVTRYNYYSKYTEAYGLPVVSSAAVSDNALKRACYIVRFLFADRKDVRDTMYKHYGRFGVIGINEKTTQIPEFSHLPDWWNKRARGLGGVLGNPISIGAEENLLCMKRDNWRGDDIYFHESAHGVAEVALRAGAIPGFYGRLTTQFNKAKRQGLWKNTYSMTDTREYFAEGMQSFFNCHVEADPPNGIHNTINTHDELKAYDPGLYDLIKEVYPCMNTYHTCRLDAPDMKMNCNGSTGGGSITTNRPTLSPVTSVKPPTDCRDKHNQCTYWSYQGYCSPSSKYYASMKYYCRITCSFC